MRNRNDDGTSGLRILILLALGGALLVSSVGTPVDARPPPQEVCVACSDSFVDVAEANGVEVGVAGSSLTIEIDRSGSGTWTERVRLTGDGVEALRTDPALRNRVVEETFERGYVAVDEPAGLATSMNGDTLVVEYEVPAMAHESVGGVIVVDYFHWHGGEARWFSLAADSMTMRGPPGTVATHAPRGRDGPQRRGPVGRERSAVRSAGDPEPRRVRTG